MTNRELAIVSFEMTKSISQTHIREGIENKNPEFLLNALLNILGHSFCGNGREVELWLQCLL